MVTFAELIVVKTFWNISCLISLDYQHNLKRLPCNWWLPTVKTDTKLCNLYPWDIRDHKHPFSFHMGDPPSRTPSPGSPADSKTSGQNIPPQFRTKWTVSIARYTSFVMSLQPPFALKCLFSTKLFLNLTKPFVSRIVCLLMSNQLLYYVWQLSSWMSWPLICC